MEPSHSGGWYFILFLIAIFAFIWWARRQELKRYTQRIDDQKDVNSKHLAESKLHYQEYLASWKLANVENLEVNKEILKELKSIQNLLAKKK